jgi:hypothetical protein
MRYIATYRKPIPIRQTPMNLPEAEGITKAHETIADKTRARPPIATYLNCKKSLSGMNILPRRRHQW